MWPFIPVFPKLPRKAQIDSIEEAMDTLCIVPFNCVPRGLKSNTRTWPWSPVDSEAEEECGKAHHLSRHFSGRWPYVEQIVSERPKEKIVDVYAATRDYR
ncbi:hypothetical protein ACP4OV_020402 [Aristida adscensionis]